MTLPCIEGREFRVININKYTTNTKKHREKNGIQV